jgi:nucleoside-diphosphate-sugar epimerase
MSKVVVLGAKGRFGRAAVVAFKAAGWSVREVARNWDGQGDAGGDRVTCDVLDESALVQAVLGCDVIVHAVHAPYEDWATVLPSITKSIINAAHASGATVLIPGNVYNDGADCPLVLHEQTPWRPTSQKGKLRVEMENSFRASGVRTIVIRGGDYIEKEKTGNWFDSHIAVKACKGRFVYPAELDIPHAWAYLPDMARAGAALCEKRAQFSAFEEFGFEGFGITGQQMADGIGQAIGVPQKTSGFPWPVLRLLGLFSPAMREVLEMRYLWGTPHVVDGTKLRETLPAYQPTPLLDALKMSAP